MIWKSSLRMLLVSCLLFFVAAVAAQPPDEIRTWTSANGVHKIQASLVKVENDVAYLKDATVLGPEATDAEPLLGMSFLSNFKFGIIAAENKLTMVKIDDDSN